MRDLGHIPVVVLSTDPADVRQRVASRSSLPVLAGPVDDRIRGLCGLPNRVVGLSWGFDIPRLVEDGDAGWLADLDGLLVDSAANERLAMQAGVPPERITFLPWGIDLDVFSCTPSSAMPGTPDVPTSSQVVLSLRAHDTVYRIGDILHAWALIEEAHPGATLVVGNGGPETDALKDLTLALAITDRVRFIGTLPETDLPELLRACACYVSAASVDGTSVTLLQAMACGAPVVVSDIPGNRGWVTEGETGRLFPVGEVNALAEVVDRVLREDSSRMTTAAAALVRGEADWGRNISRLEQALFARI